MLLVHKLLSRRNNTVCVCVPIYIHIKIRAACSGYDRNDRTHVQLDRKCVTFYKFPQQNAAALFK